MRINKFVAQASGLSRRSADTAIASGRVFVNGSASTIGQSITSNDAVTLDGHIITLPIESTLIMLNKPVGFVCSRNGQGSQTIYDLLPEKYRLLKPIGRLDKNSSGLLLLTDNGALANELTHPRFAKQKVYKVTINKPLTPEDKPKFKRGIRVDDYMSNLDVTEVTSTKLQITISEGRNRQIRRTFDALGYSVTTLHRTKFGPYTLNNLLSGTCKTVEQHDTVQQ